MECGTKHERSASTRFCSACGHPFNSTKKPEIKTAQNLEVEVEGGETIPEVNGLEVEIPQANNRKTTLGEIAFTANSVEKFNRPKEKRLSKAKFQEEWRRTAGPRRAGESIEIG